MYILMVRLVTVQKLCCWRDIMVHTQLNHAQKTNHGNPCVAQSFCCPVVDQIMVPKCITK